MSMVTVTGVGSDIKAILSKYCHDASSAAIKTDSIGFWTKQRSYAGVNANPAIRELSET